METFDPTDQAEVFSPKYFRRFCAITGVERIARGVELAVDEEFREKLRVEVIRDGIIRLKMSRHCLFDDRPTFAVCAPIDAETPKFSVEENDEFVRVATSEMRVTVYRTPFHIDAHRADGSVIFESFIDEDGDPWAYAVLNETFVVRRRCRREDAFLGLGQKTGAFNRRGRNFELWNTDVMNPNVAGGFDQKVHSDDPRCDPTSTEFDPYYISIPFFYHLPDQTGAMAGFFFDNGYRGAFEFARPLEFIVSFEGGQYTEYVFAGSTMEKILGDYTWLTGRMQPPPLWSLGYHQCRWFAYTQEAIEKLAETHRRRKIPCDSIWLDIDYMDGYRVFTWNKERFPDHRAMFRELRSRGFRMVTIIDPGVKYERGYRVFDEAVERDLLCQTEAGTIYAGQVWPGRTGFPDFTLAEARKWWGEWNARHIESGVSGIWNDMNEPATGDLPCDSMRFGRGRFSHERFHNQYALLMAMATVEGLLEHAPEKRPFVLSRAGSPGIQRYAANWLGDNISRWDHLAMSVAMSLGLGISGQPFVGADVGGFMGNSSAELMVRWYQCAALTPFFRNHNNANQKDQYPWVCGESIEDLCRKAIELRYTLLPYIYSQFMESAETGWPVQRPLIFFDPSDRAARDLDDEYLFGDHLLVAPVLQKSATARQVYLPRGTWHHWHTGEIFDGRQFVIAPTPMNYIPLFARGGAVIPTWPHAPQSTMDHRAETIDLHVFLPREGGETRSVLHEDDGSTFAFRAGAFVRTEFVLEKKAGGISLRASVTGKGFPEFARTSFRLVVHGHVTAEGTLNGQKHELKNNALAFENAGVDFSFKAETAG